MCSTKCRRGDEGTITNVNKIVQNFRTTFTVADKAVFTGLNISLIKDDGSCSRLCVCQLSKYPFPHRFGQALDSLGVEWMIV